MANGVGIRVSGKLFWENEAAANGRSALLLTGVNPDPAEAGLLFLRFAYVLMGTEAPLFPSFLIDDWGGEIKGVSLYSWVKENGILFPRAEIFGFDRQGNQVQYFLRELELFARLLCYVFPDREAPLAEGSPLPAILLPDSAVAEPEKAKRPSHLKRPFNLAHLSWWRVPPALTQFDFAQLDKNQSLDFI